MKNKKIFFILLIILLSLIPRLMLINTPLWYDEACSWFSAMQSFPMGIFQNLVTLDLQHTPLYFCLLHFWMKIFGDSEIALRSLSLIFGICSIFLIFRTGEKLFNKKFGVIFAILMAVNPIMVIFSVEVRMYPIAVFLVLLSMNFLIDFEKNTSNASALKMTITNILLPYTFVGGIFYNISLAFFYLKHLLKNKNEKFKIYLKYLIIEGFALIPFWLLVIYYAIIRNSFVISHEIPLKFAHIVDIIRNFFGTNINANPYWPITEPYQITFIFALTVIIPCSYFIYGYVKNFSENANLTKVLFNITLSAFTLFLIFSALGIYVCTNRYIIYLYPLMIMLSVYGLTKKLSKKHFYTFISLYILTCTISTILFIPKFKISKEFALKDVLTQSQNLNLNGEDIIILPFSADAPYYFRNLSSARVFNGDFHKLVRNPYGKYYDSQNSKIMAGKNKYELIYKKINENNVFSQNFYNYFGSEVNNNIDSGRYLLLAMYSNDNNAIIPIEQLRKEVQNVEYVEKNILDVMFKKYICDIAAMINLSFKFVKSYKKDNYTYYLYQKI